VFLIAVTGENAKLKSVNRECFTCRDTWTLKIVCPIFVIFISLFLVKVRKASETSYDPFRSNL